MHGSLTRRSVLGLTGLATASTFPLLSTSNAPATPSATIPARWANEFGAVGDGAVDDTEALQNGIDWADEHTGALLIGPGFYAVQGLVISGQTRVIGVGGGNTRYPRNGTHGSVMLTPVVGSTSTKPLVTIASTATGAGLSHIALVGYNFRTGGNPDDKNNWPSRPGLVVRGGIEVTLESVRVFRFVGAGIEIVSLANARWTDVFVDNCGAPTVPAMSISSPTDGVTNFLVFDGLTIERSANTALAIGAGDDARTDWATNLTFIGLHLESNTDSSNVWPLNSAPLLDIGNIRAVTFVSSQILGAPVPLVQYRQRIGAKETVADNPGGDPRDQQGGVQFIGGQIKQHPSSPVRVAAMQVSGNGRGFSATNVRFAAMDAPGVLIADDYVCDATVTACTFRLGRDYPNGTAPADVVDRRTDAVKSSWAERLFSATTVEEGDLSVKQGHFNVPGRSRTGGTTISPLNSKAVGAGWVDMGPRGPGTDTSGRLWMWIHQDSSKNLFRVTFERPYAIAPVVMLIPRNELAASISLYAEIDDPDAGRSGFTVSCHEKLAATAGQVIYLFDYVVIGKMD